MFMGDVKCCPVDVYGRFRGKFCLHVQGSLLRIEADCSSEMPLNAYQTTQNQIPEDSNLHGHLCEGLGSHTECACVTLECFVDYRSSETTLWWEWGAAGTLCHITWTSMTPVAARQVCNDSSLIWNYLAVTGRNVTVTSYVCYSPQGSTLHKADS